jgi:hypothetical protein
MPCFYINVCLPENLLRPAMREMNEKRMKILLRTRNLHCFRKLTDDGLEYKVTLCDQDAIRFLNDIPSPLYVKEIRYFYDMKWLLFSNRWLPDAKEPTIKPVTLVEKDVFWAAKATERWTPKHKIEMPRAV